MHSRVLAQHFSQSCLEPDMQMLQLKVLTQLVVLSLQKGVGLCKPLLTRSCQPSHMSNLLLEACYDECATSSCGMQ